jgi:hypothetical protein
MQRETQARLTRLPAPKPYWTKLVVKPNKIRLVIIRRAWTRL